MDRPMERSRGFRGGARHHVGSGGRAGRATAVGAKGGDMGSQDSKAAAFRALHERPGAFIIPNPWDAGTAKLLASLGFEALATTSLGLANSLGRPDGAGVVSRSEVLENCRVIAEATDLPVNADLENGYAHEPRAAAEMIRLAANAGVVGGSIEDATGDPANPIYHFGVGVKRISVGGSLSRLALAAFLRGAREMKDRGAFTWMRDTVPSKELKTIFKR